MGRLDGKVALLSGGARGLGAVGVKMLVEEGAKAVFGDVLADEGQKIQAEILGLGGDATFIHLDVIQESDWARAVRLTIDRYGKLDVLVNNAGVVITTAIEDTTAEEWDRIMAINAKGVFLGTKQAIPAMRASGGGSIVNISSTAGLVGGVHSNAAYTASKGAIRLFTKATAIQHACDNIRCNSVHPGPIDTEMLQQGLVATGLLQQRIASVPLGRIGAAEDIAYGVIYLASDESSWVTGSELIIDGGSTAL